MRRDAACSGFHGVSGSTKPVFEIPVKHEAEFGCLGVEGLG